MSSDLQRLTGVLDYLVDPHVGIVHHLELVPREPGDPDFFQFMARACNTGAFAQEKNFSNTGGASSDRARAAAKAVGEAVERYCGAIYEAGDLPLYASEDAPFQCVAPGDFALFSPAQYDQPGFPWTPFDETTPIRWAPAIDVLTGETIHVPAAMVFVPYFYYQGTGDSPITQPISTGLSCHCSFAEAAVNSICEVIERDWVTITWQARLSHPRIRIESLSEANRDLVGRFERAGLRVTLLDATLDSGVPSCLGIIRGCRPEQAALVVAGATHPDPEVAVRKSLEELEHTRRYSQQLRSWAEPFVPEPDFSNVTDQMTHLHYWCDPDYAGTADFLLASPVTMDFASIPSCSTGDARKDVQRLAEMVRATGHRVLLADLTTPDIGELGLAVTRAVIPGYHPLYMGYQTRATGGTRLWSVPQKLGHAGIDVEYGDNPFPHPYP